jgi:hypothetical protein
MEPDDVADLADILVALDVRRGNGERFFLPWHLITLI